MKKIISIFFLSMITLQTQGVELKSKLALGPAGEFQKFLEVSCAANDKPICNEVCNNDVLCKVPEVLCADCITQKSQLMYSIFTDVNSIFKANMMFIDTAQLIGFLKNKKFLSIPPDLFINMFTPEKKELLKKEFEQLCYIHVESATLLTTVNENNQVDEIVGVICKDTMGSVVLPITLNPEFSNEQTDFWQKLNTELGLPINNLKLKMTTELILD